MGGNWETGNGGKLIFIKYLYSGWENILRLSASRKFISQINISKLQAAYKYSTI